MTLHAEFLGSLEHVISSRFQLPDGGGSKLCHPGEAFEMEGRVDSPGDDVGNARAKLATEGCDQVDAFLELLKFTRIHLDRLGIVTEFGDQGIKIARNLLHRLHVCGCPLVESSEILHKPRRVGDCGNGTVFIILQASDGSSREFDQAPAVGSCLVAGIE